MDFVEPDSKGEVNRAVFHIQADQLNTVIDQIKTSYTRIKNKEFTQGCDLPECRWCSFVRYYYKGETFTSLGYETQDYD
jgi:DNA helicase-2/ATP-dependent DNA helicase PcrA